MDANGEPTVSSDRGATASVGAPELLCEDVPIDDDEDDNHLAVIQEQFDVAVDDDNNDSVN